MGDSSRFVINDLSGENFFNLNIFDFPVLYIGEVSRENVYLINELQVLCKFGEFRAKSPFQLNKFVSIKPEYFFLGISKAARVVMLTSYLLVLLDLVDKTDVFLEAVS